MEDTRAYLDNCTLGVQSPQTIIVRQVIGEKMRQKVLDIHVVVPERKPAIEQIVDVFVKELEVLNVEVIPDKVVVRGEFEIKTIYVACLPDQPVHAVEIKHYKWTQDIDIPGARRGMDADAAVVVEFVDYDIHQHYHKHRAFKHKYGDCDDNCNHNHGCDDDCNHNHNHCDDDCHHHGCDDDCHHHHHDCCLREFDVSVVLKVTAKVLADREVALNNNGTLPPNPKG